VAVQGCGDLRERFATTLGAAVYEGLEWLLSASSTVVLAKSGGRDLKKAAVERRHKAEKIHGSDGPSLLHLQCGPRHPRS
jgi:hypothetical protein